MSSLEPEKSMNFRRYPRYSREASRAVRSKSEAKMRQNEPARTGPAELRGILTALSTRFYAGGWGFGSLQTETELVRITGTLEGHVPGTSVIVRGQWVNNPRYGSQVECSSIMVDSVSGELSVIHAWAKKHCDDYEREVMYAVRGVPADDRWLLLMDVQALQKRGVKEEASIDIAIAAQRYMASIKTKRALMELGFTDSEAELLFARYEEEALKQVEDCPYDVVIERVLPFGRIDIVVGTRFGRNDPKRLQAAVVQALVGLLRDGHTAGDVLGVQKLGAEIAGVYVDAIVRTALPGVVQERGDMLQLKAVARQEESIARWLVRAAALED